MTRSPCLSKLKMALKRLKTRFRAIYFFIPNHATGVAGVEEAAFRGKYTYEEKFYA